MSCLPRAIVIRTAGTNCDAEMVRAFALAGASPELVHLDRLIAEPGMLGAFDLIGFPGGFSYGDDCGAGRVQAMRIREGLLPALRSAVDRGAAMIGVCNGFQVLVQTGLLPGDEPRQTIALAANAGGRFIDAWVPVEFERDSVCVWTVGLADAAFADEAMMLPIAHGEGRFVAESAGVIARLERRGQVVLRYRDDVNGSMGRIAGICDPTGRVFGLMPHPDRYLDWTLHPFWTRLRPENRRGDTPGLRMFRSAVAAVNHGRDRPAAVVHG